MTDKIKLLIIQTGLRTPSNTETIAKYCEKKFKQKYPLQFETEFLNLKEQQNELCNGEKITNYSQNTQEINEKIKNTDFYILASPVYNNSISGVCKNFLDIHSDQMSKKYVALIENSYGITSIQKPYKMLKTIFEYHKINLIDFTINTTYKSFNDKGELIDDVAKTDIDKIANEFLKLHKQHKTKNPIEN